MANSLIHAVKAFIKSRMGKYDNINDMFHYRYYKKMFGKYILVVLRNGDILKGGFNAELPEVDSIKVGSRVVKIEDIDMVKIIEE